MNVKCFVFALLFMFIGCERDSSSKKLISYEPFTSNCGVSFADIEKNFTKVLSGYPSGYEKLTNEGKIGFVVDQERKEILSTLSILTFQDLDLQKLYRFFEEHGVVLIGDELKELQKGQIFCVQKIKTNRIFICYLHFRNNEYVLEIVYDCIRD